MKKKYKKNKIYNKNQKSFYFEDYLEMAMVEGELNQSSLFQKIEYMFYFSSFYL